MRCDGWGRTKSIGDQELKVRRGLIERKERSIFHFYVIFQLIKKENFRLILPKPISLLKTTSDDEEEDGREAEWIIIFLTIN